MTGAAMFERIVSDAAILGGTPCIKGTRLSVEFLLELATSGASQDEIVQAYPRLTREDVEEAFQYAARLPKDKGRRVAGMA